MPLKMIRLLALPAALLYVNSAFAFFDAEGLIGKRYYDLNAAPTVKVGSTEAALAAHIDPIPLIPISFGAKAAFGTLDTGDLKGYYNASSIDSANVFEAGLDIMAWIPLIPVITPYVRLDIPVYGTWDVKGKVNSPTEGNVPFERDASLNGLQLSAGIKYDVIPLIHLLLEVNYGNETWKETTAKTNNVDVAKDSKSHALTSYGVFIGLEAGI